MLLLASGLLACAADEAPQPPTPAPRMGTKPRVSLPPFVLDPPSAPDSPMSRAIVTVVKKNSGRIQTCVQLALMANEHMNGTVAVGWTITAGRVSDAHLVSNDTGEPVLGTCIVNAVRTMRFSPDTSAVVVAFPWVISGQ